MSVGRTTLAWLLEGSDPSVRARALTELEDRPADDADRLAAEGAIGREGWAASLLTEQLPNGAWSNSGPGGSALYRPKYTATNWRLIILSDLGVPGRHPAVERAVQLLLERWSGSDGAFGGTDSETCITGNALRYLVRFGHGDHPEARRALTWLLDAQKPDGGWHCFPSPTGTLDGWEAMAAFAAIPKPQRSAAVERAVQRGAEFYLERGLLNEGPTQYAPWGRLHYPVHYYYDLLVGLDMMTRLGFGSDPRLRPALERLEQKRDADGRWPLEGVHPDLPADEEYAPAGPVFPIELETPGRASRWISVTALSVLRRAGRV